ncbi:MAG: DUF6506 family protein [Henriciella sp.]
MADQMRYLFLIKARGYDGEVRFTDLSNLKFQTTIACSSSFEKLLEACVDQVTAGIQVVELCGGFTNTEACLILERVGGTAAVGHVKFDKAGLAKLHQIGFGSG